MLADRFRRSKVSAFHLTSKLREQGVVVRRADPSERRSKLIYFTPKGSIVWEGKPDELRDDDDVKQRWLGV